MSSSSPADRHRILVADARTVCRMLGVSRATLWRLVHKGKFPSAILISANRRGFVMAEIADWIERRKAERRS